MTLSGQLEGRLPRICITLLRGRVRAALAATSGVETADDIARLPARCRRRRHDRLRAAASRARHAAVLLDGLDTWMRRKGFQTVHQFRGILAVPAGTDGEAYERTSYVSAMRAANAGAYETY